MTETKRPEKVETKKPAAAEAPKANPVAGLREAKKSEQIRPAGMQEQVSKKAWENPGKFDTTRDSKGRTTRIEGWIKPTNESRSRQDSDLTRKIGKNGSSEHATNG